MHLIMSTVPSNIDKAAIDQELTLIFASEHFVNAERMRDFLEYVVAETLSGRADRIKSYSIAIEVFKRDADFDASLDPIVRTSANRLRAALERYNQNAVNTTGVKITLPKGRYVPVFTQLPTDVEAVPNETSGNVSIVAEPPFFRRKPSWFPAWAFGICLIAVVAAVAFYFSMQQSQNVRPHDAPILIATGVTADSGQPHASEIAQALSEILVSKLSAYGNSRVVDNRDGDLKLEDFLVRESDVYLLKADVRETNGSVSIVWQLDDVRSKEVAWASEEVLRKNFTIDGSAGRLAGRVLGLEGALPTLMAGLYSGTDDQLGCLTKPQRQALFYHSVLQQEVKDCLEEVVSFQPSNAEAWAILAQVYARLGNNAASFGKDTEKYDIALKNSAMKAMELAPNTLLTKQALMYYAFYSKNLKAFDDISRDVLEKYRDPHLKMRIGSAYMTIGLLDEGSNLLSVGIKESGEDFGLVYMPLAFEKYYHDDYQGALSLLDKVGISDYHPVLLLKTASLAKLGRQTEAKAALAELYALRPNYGRNLYGDMRRNNVSEGIFDSLAAGLALVGVDVYKPD